MAIKNSKEKFRIVPSKKIGEWNVEEKYGFFYLPWIRHTGYDFYEIAHFSSVEEAKLAIDDSIEKECQRKEWAENHPIYYP